MTILVPVTLRGERVTLRRLTPADASAIYGIFSDPEVTRFWSRPAMTGLDQARDYLREIMQGYESGALLQLGVERNEDRALMGTCTLFHLDSSNRRAEIGYALGRIYWGQGWMTEALECLLEHAFTAVGLHRLEADIDPRNLASHRSLLRLGFLQEGLMRERWIVDGEVSDTGFYGLLKRDWLQRVTPEPGAA